MFLELVFTGILYLETIHDILKQEIYKITAYILTTLGLYSCITVKPVKSLVFIGLPYIMYSVLLYEKNIWAKMDAIIMFATGMQTPHPFIHMWLTTTFLVLWILYKKKSLKQEQPVAFTPPITTSYLLLLLI